jgi:hypothetical protein
MEFIYNETMTKIEKFQFDPDDLQAFYEYRMNFDALVNKEQPGTILPTEISYMNVLHALQRIKKENITVLSLFTQWLGPLTLLKQCGLGELAGIGNENVDGYAWERAADHAPLDRKSCVLWVVATLSLQMEDPTGYDEVPEHLDEIISMMENVLYNEGKPLSDWKLTETQMIHYASDIFESGTVNILPDDRLNLFRRCIDACIDLDINEAYRIKAFSCAGGDRAFLCDWEFARVHLTESASSSDDPKASVKLGDIYYEGRTEGKPNYIRAYFYYSLAAFQGDHEGEYKCADLLREGKGCQQSTLAADNLLEKAYGDTKELMVDGNFLASFPEAAVRMGDAAVGNNAFLALSYYLEAMLTLNIRMRYFYDTGDDLLYSRVLASLKDARKTVGKDCLDKKAAGEYPYVIDRLFKTGRTVRVTVRKTNSGKTKLIFTRDREKGEIKKLILTLESMSYCRLSDSFTVSVEDLDTRLTEGMSFLADGIDYIGENGTTCFYMGDTQVLSLRLGKIVYHDSKEIAKRDEPFRDFVAAVDADDETVHDYLCSVPGVRTGEHLLAEMDGEDREVVCIGIFHARMSDMNLNDETCPSIIRKTGKILLA